MAAADQVGAGQSFTPCPMMRVIGNYSAVIVTLTVLSTLPSCTLSQKMARNSCALLRVCLLYVYQKREGR